MDGPRKHYTCKYSTVETPFADIIKISREELYIARRALNEKGHTLLILPELDRWSLQCQRQHDYFVDRVQENEKFKDSPFTPESGTRPHIRSYEVEICLFPEGVAFSRDVSQERESDDYPPLELFSLTKEGLGNLVRMCRLPYEPSMERMREDYELGDVN